MSVLIHRALAGRRVLVTGHTGFKGSWLSLWLAQLDARVSGLALAPPTTPSAFEAADVREVLDQHVVGDIRDPARVRATLDAVEPDVILHLAAQSVVLEGYRQPLDTFATNAHGTAVLLDAVRESGLRAAIVVVTTDKCYANDGSGRPFVESDALGGHDPYSASKAAAEIVAASYRESYFDPAGHADHGVLLATARAGNVIGGGDWTADGLIADVARSVMAGRPVPIRHPRAVRPWQHVLEPLSGYLTLAGRLLEPEPAAARAWNFGPRLEDDATVEDVVGALLKAWGTGSMVDGSRPGDPPEAAVLRLDDTAARTELGWTSRWRLDEAVRRTAEWWRRYADDPRSARSATLDDLAAYERAG